MSNPMQLVLTSSMPESNPGFSRQKGGLRPLEALGSESQSGSSGLREGEKQSGASCFIFQKNTGILLFQLPPLWLKKNTAKRLLLRLNKQTNEKERA